MEPAAEFTKQLGRTLDGPRSIDYKEGVCYGCLITTRQWADLCEQISEGLARRAGEPRIIGETVELMGDLARTCRETTAKLEERMP